MGGGGPFRLVEQSNPGLQRPRQMGVGLARDKLSRARVYGRTRCHKVVLARLEISRI